MIQENTYYYKLRELVRVTVCPYVFMFVWNEVTTDLNQYRVLNH